MNELLHLVARCYERRVNAVESDGWVVSLAARGHNGVVYRAQSDTCILAAKVSNIDGRDRAGREKKALAAIGALQDRGVPEVIATASRPNGLGIDVVLMTWCEGTPLHASPPTTSPLWERIVHALAEIHNLPIVEPLPEAVLGVSPRQVVEDMRVRLVPSDDQLFARAARSVPDTLPPGPRSVIHCDANLENVLVADDGSITIVDWENAGLGDPCFDVGDLLASPALVTRDPAELAPLAKLHAQLAGDERLVERTLLYSQLMIAWWVIRLRQELRSPVPRLDGVKRHDVVALQELLAVYEKRAESLFQAS